MSAVRKVTYRGRVFDGDTLHPAHCVTLEEGVVTHHAPAVDVDPVGELVELGDDILCPGFVDLQVNGGGGVLFNDDPSVASLECIARTHFELGTAALLPTLITDTPEKTRAAIDAVKAAIAAGSPGIAGLHLEGPHLSVERKGVHDASLIRPMSEADLSTLLRAAKDLPVLMVTVAPENVTREQVAKLVNAGAVVSLGHTDADFETCMAFADAGATCVTHLFNAMSQLGSRAPGLVGAALQHGGLSAGMIADGVHVHPATMRAALESKSGPGSLYLVSDAMPCAGTSLQSFTLGNRTVYRRDGQLSVEDGTLAGADLTLAQAVRVLVQDVCVETETALSAATSIPARVIGLSAPHGQLSLGVRPTLIRLGPDMEFKSHLR